MEKPIERNHRFYQNLGKLFYAIVAVDKKVEAIEINTLKEIIKQQWSSVNFSDSEALQQILITFDRLYSEEYSKSEALFLEFIIYKNKENHLFSNSIKTLIMQTSNAIASSFSGRNKSELMMLAKLEIELKKEM